MNDNITFILVSLINAILLTTSTTNLLLFPPNRINKIFIYVYTLACQLFFAQQFGQNITLFTVGGSLLIIISSNRHFIINTIFALLGYLLSIFINYIFISFFNLFNFTVNDLYSNGYYLLTFVTIYTLIVFLITYYLGKYIRQLYAKNTLYFSRKIQLLLSLEVVVCFLIFVFNIIQGENEGYPSNVIYFNTVLFGTFFVITLIIFFFCLHILQKNHELQSVQKEKEVMEEYMLKLEDLYQNVRSFKHDYINILSTMQGYIHDKDTNKLQEYFETEILPRSKRLSGKEDTIGKLSNIKLQGLKGILYSKLLTAMNNNLNITLEIQEEINEISMDTLDLAIIVGAFLDNAIDASFESEEKKLSIFLISTEDSVILIISNSTPDKDIDLVNIYDKDITSKEGHSGLGLYNAYKILCTYSNIIHSTNYSDCLFTQTLEICTKL